MQDGNALEKRKRSHDKLAKVYSRRLAELSVLVYVGRSRVRYSEVVCRRGGSGRGKLVLVMCLDLSTSVFV